MKRIFWIAFGFVVVMVVWLFILHYRWENLPRTTRSIYILDKTVSNSKFDEHKSLFWVLSNLKFQKPDTTPYLLDKDYFGFFPIDPERGTFDFRTIRLAEITRYADNLDAVYYVDCFGIYSESWTISKNSLQEQKIYGGLNQNDYLLLKAMKERGKLIIAEHNLFSNSGGGLVKEKLSELFGFSWTGWVGRSYSSFDTTKANCPPRWIVNLYRAEHGSWPNTHGGIVLVKEKEQVVLLVDGKDIENSDISIVSKPFTVQNFGVEPKVTFTGWFEIINAGPQFDLFSTFSMDITLAGSSLLKKYGIPESFPAAIGDSSGYQLYYFAGDFAHTPAYLFTSEMVGGSRVNELISSVVRPKGYAFFNDFYRPFISKVLKSYVPPISPIDSTGISN